jgi:hypothetical protein
MRVVQVECVICASGRDLSRSLFSEFDLTKVRCANCWPVYVNLRLSDVE